MSVSYIFLSSWLSV